MDNEPRKNRFDISLEDLETFIAVANLQGIGRAARHLNLSQPSVSNRIRRLEEKLNVRLLDRGTSGIRLTAEGQALHAEATETLVGLTELMQRFHAAGTNGRRHLAVSVTSPMAAIKLARLFSDFRDAQPGIVVHVHEQMVDEAVEALRQGRSEFALMSCDALPDMLERDLLVTDDCLLVTSRNHPLRRLERVTLADALEHPVLLPGYHLPQVASLYEAVAARGLVMRLAPEVEGVRHPLTMLVMAAAGLGVFFSPRTLTPDEIRSSVATIDIADCTIPRRFGLVRMRDRRPSPQGAAFRGFVIAARDPEHRTWPDARRIRPSAASLPDEVITDDDAPP